MSTQTKRHLPLGLLATAVACHVTGVALAQVPVLTTKDKVAARVGVFRGNSGFTLDAGGRTGQAGDRAVDFGMGTGPVYVQDASFLNPLAQNDEMTFAIWAKKYDTVDGSAFWANSPSSSGTGRGFQAHLPWSNNNIYFDTAGCCNPPQRINGDPSGFGGWNANWNEWHFYVFVKRGVDKQIWIDGQMFLDQSAAGVEAAPLPTDFTDLFIGSDGAGGGLFHALVDDFSIYGTALSEATIGQLFNGTLPTALPASNQLAAYWDFNDFPEEGQFLSITPPANTATAAPDLIQIVHIDGAIPWDATKVSLKVDSAAVTPTFAKDGIKATVSYVPTPKFTGQTTHKASFSYPGAGGATATIDWEFIVGPYTKDVLQARIGTFMGGSTFTAGGGGHSGQAADLGADFGNGTGPVRVHDGTFLNALSQNDELSFAFWVKKPGIEAGSAFWANSPSSAADQRGFQAHVPWSDSVIYFDTVGCCGAATERINANISTFAGYTDATWWNGWHHFVFQKKFSTKEIWIDGQYFLTGDNTDPLPTDFTTLHIGATGPGVNLSSGVFDDFAIFGTALTQDSVTALFNGSLPTALPSSDKLTAYWNFNDFPATGLFSCIVPAPYSTNARPELVQVIHLDATVVWDQSKVGLKVDDVAVPFTFSKVGSRSTVSYSPSPWFAAGSTHKATLTYPGEGNATETLEWPFTVGAHLTIGTELRTGLGTGDNTQPGLKARVWQVDQPGSNALVNRTHRAEQELAGIIGPNVADLTAATAGVFALDKVNWNQDVPAGVGSFPNNETPIPGIPGTGSKPDDSIAGEVITYIEFPTAGYYTMGVNSDDGFKVTVADTPPANNLALVVAGVPSAAGSYHAISGPVATSKPFTGPVSGNLVYMDPTDGCTAPVNAAALQGNIAFVDRGTCEFTAKIKAAKDAGAIAVVVVNNRDEFNAEGIFPIEMGAGAAGYQDIPAVMISMPDGDKIKTGIASGLTASLTPDSTTALGEFNGGRGASDTVFSFIVPTAGVYPFRCVWYEGNGGANLEWFSVSPCGEKILINDRATPGALNGFRARTATPQPQVTFAITQQGGNISVTSDPQPLPAGWVIQSASSLDGQWTTQAGANTPLLLPIGSDAAYFLRATKP